MLFDGVPELIDGLARAGYGWGIVTNKPMRFTDKLVPWWLSCPPAVVVMATRWACPSPTPNPCCTPPPD